MLFDNRYGSIEQSLMIRGYRDLERLEENIAMNVLAKVLVANKVESDGCFYNVTRSTPADKTRFRCSNKS